MKYKVLVTGNNDSAIDDFFVQMNEKFEVMTTSYRYEDIIRHVLYFKPDLFLYCLYNESREDLIKIANVKFRLSQSRIPLILLGLKEDCDEFDKVAPNVSNLTLYRPISVGVIQDKLIELLKERKFLEVAGMQKEEPVNENQPYAEILAALEESEESEETEEPAESAKPPKKNTRQRKHVLVVDDNAMMLKVIKEHLHDNYDVATAVSGKVALRFLERKTTDLILLDYEMPDESGPAVLEKLRANEQTRDIPVIFLTGVTETKKIKEALALKPQNYLLKPIEKEKLLETISSVIG